MDSSFGGAIDISINNSSQKTQKVPDFTNPGSQKTQA
jgi:hypothetical protein